MNAIIQPIELVDALGRQVLDMNWWRLAIVAVAVLTAVYSLIHLWVIGNREALEQRLTSVKRSTTRGRNEGPQLATDKTTSGSWYERLGTVLAATPVVGSTDRKRLARLLANAGFRSGKGQLATFVAAKLGMLLVAVGLASAALQFHAFAVHSVLLKSIFMLAVALVGWRIPDVALSHLGARRREEIEQALPDALDLLVISAEAGLSLEQAIDVVSREMTPAVRSLGEEFSITSAELRVLGNRREALENLANRVNLPSLRSVIATLNQTMRYGTPLAQSLRVVAAEMRTARLLRMEERAARMPVLLTIPLMGFILPSLVLVCAGPAILGSIHVFRVLARY